MYQRLLMLQGCRSFSWLVARECNSMIQSFSNNICNYKVRRQMQWRGSSSERGPVLSGFPYPLKRCKAGIRSLISIITPHRISWQGKKMHSVKWGLCALAWVFTLFMIIVVQQKCFQINFTLKRIKISIITKLWRTKFSKTGIKYFS